MTYAIRRHDRGWLGRPKGMIDDTPMWCVDAPGPKTIGGYRQIVGVRVYKDGVGGVIWAHGVAIVDPDTLDPDMVAALTAALVAYMMEDP